MTIESSKPGTAPGPAHASVFVWLVASSSIWHYTSSGTEILDYWFRFDPVVTPLIALAIVTAFLGALFPNRTWAVLLFAAGQLTAIAVRFPRSSIAHWLRRRNARNGRSSSRGLPASMLRT